MKLDDALSGVTRLGIDTAPFIYFLERNPTYVDRVRDVFQRITKGHIVGVSSVVTLAEVLVRPKQLGNAILAHQYQRLLLRSRHFSLQVIDATSAERAAALRGRYAIRLPDAFQIAAAIQSGCTAFLTNDRQLQCVTDLRVIVLDDLTQ
mgnify:CR=1 FL=1